MSDSISRADAIEAVGEWMQKEYGYLDLNRAERLIDALTALPSAETHEIRTETHGVCSDLISRQDVLCILEKMMIDRPLDSDRWVIRDIDKAIKALPSADAVEYESTVTVNSPISISADAVPQLKQTDTLILADALRYLAQDTERHLSDRTRADALRQQFLKYGASMCKGGAE